MNPGRISLPLMKSPVLIQTRNCTNLIVWSNPVRAVLWIRIQSDPNLFARSGMNSPTCNWATSQRPSWRPTSSCRRRRPSPRQSGGWGRSWVRAPRTATGPPGSGTCCTLAPWLIMAMLSVGCGGSLVVHQTVKPAVPGSNPASLQPAGTCQFLVMGSQQGWHANCRLASEGQRGKKNTRIQKK